MGFEEADCIDALRATRNDGDGAVSQNPSNFYQAQNISHELQYYLKTVFGTQKFSKSCPAYQSIVKTRKIHYRFHNFHLPCIQNRSSRQYDGWNFCALGVYHFPYVETFFAEVILFSASHAC